MFPITSSVIVASKKKSMTLKLVCLIDPKLVYSLALTHENEIKEPIISRDVRCELRIRNFKARK